MPAKLGRARALAKSLHIRFPMGKRLKGMVWRWRMKKWFKYRKIGPRIILDFMRTQRLKIDQGDTADVSSLGAQARRWYVRAMRVKRLFQDERARTVAGAAILRRLLSERQSALQRQAKAAKDNAKKRLTLYQKQQRSGMAGAAKKAFDKNEINALLHIAETPLPEDIPLWALEAIAAELAIHRRRVHRGLVRGYLEDWDHFEAWFRHEAEIWLAKAQVMDRIPSKDPSTGAPWRVDRFIEIYMQEEAAFGPKPPRLGLAPEQPDLDLCVEFGQHQPEVSPGRKEAAAIAARFVAETFGEPSAILQQPAVEARRQEQRRESRRLFDEFVGSEAKRGVRLLLSAPH